MQRTVCRRGTSTCFNEAEAIKPRNHRDPGQSVTAHLNPRFNEAEAIKPRNRGMIVSPGLGSSSNCFNEAEAIKPRNLD